MKRMPAILAVLLGLASFLSAAPAKAQRTMTSNGLGCEIYAAWGYGGDMRFYPREQRMVTMNPEWKAKVRSAQCSRYCKVFLYEQPNLTVFFTSFERDENFSDIMGKAQSMQIYCGNDGDMRRHEVSETRAAEEQRKAAKGGLRLQTVPAIDTARPLLRPVE